MPWTSGFAWPSRRIVLYCIPVCAVGEAAGAATQYLTMRCNGGLTRARLPRGQLRAVAHSASLDPVCGALDGSVLAVSSKRRRGVGNWSTNVLFLLLGSTRPGAREAVRRACGTCRWRVPPACGCASQPGKPFRCRRDVLAYDRKGRACDRRVSVRPPSAKSKTKFSHTSSCESCP